MAVGDLYRAIVGYVVDKEPCSYSLYYRHTADSGNQAPATLLVPMIDTAIKAAYLAAFPASVGLNYLRAYRIFTGPGCPGYLSYDESSDVGSYSGEVLPRNNSVVLHLKGNGSSPQYHRRLYLSGLGEGATTGGALDPAWSTGVGLTFGQALLMQLVSGGDTFDPVIVPKMYGGAPVVAGTYQTIYSGGWRTRLSGLRRRTTREVYVP